MSILCRVFITVVSVDLKCAIAPCIFKYVRKRRVLLSGANYIEFRASDIAERAGVKLDAAPFKFLENKLSDESTARIDHLDITYTLEDSN